MELPNFLQTPQNVEQILTLADIHRDEYVSRKEIAKQRVRQCALQLVSFKRELANAEWELTEADQRVDSLRRRLQGPNLVPPSRTDGDGGPSTSHDS